jgi:hypothetical protein
VAAKPVAAAAHHMAAAQALYWSKTFPLIGFRLVLRSSNCFVFSHGDTEITKHIPYFYFLNYPTQ